MLSVRSIETYPGNYRGSPMDDRGDQGAGPGETEEVHVQDWLSRKLSGPFKAQDRSRRPRRKRETSERTRVRAQHRQARPPDRSSGEADDAPDGERLSRPDEERDRLSRGYPPAAVL